MSQHEIKVMTYPTTGRTPDPSTIGLLAVIDRVNRAGGVCGRHISVRLYADIDDGESFPPADTFAIVAPAVHPRIHDALVDGDVDRAGIPVVGGAGGPPAQYTSRWAWPVGPSTDDAVRVMVNHAWATGARSFGLVHDANELYGNPAAAFEAAVRAKTGAPPKAVVQLQPRAGPYDSEAEAFVSKCGCDFVALSLLRETASAWLRDLPNESEHRKRGFGTKATGVTPSLLNEQFRDDCGRWSCENVLAWTGYMPPPLSPQEAEMQQYVKSVRDMSSTVDLADPVVQGAYIGAELFVRALQDVGSKLTRVRLRDALDGMTFRSSHVTDLRWGPVVPGQRVANRAFRAAQLGVGDSGMEWQRP